MFKILGVILLSIHGLIHFFGFIKAFHWGQVSQLSKDISKPVGLLWLMVGIIFLGAAISYALNYRQWWALGASGLILSQILIFTTWQDAKFGSIGNALILVMVVLAYSAFRFYNVFSNDVRMHLKTDAGTESEIMTESDILHLPEPVQKYLRYTGSVGKPKVHNFRVDFSGKIRKNEKSEWMPLTSTQYNFMEVPARLFFMNAIMKTLPVAGYHCYKNAKAFMDIRLFSLLPVQFMDGSDMDLAETVTFFNDMCVLAPATLIDRRIQWLEVAGNKVNASFVNKGNQITAWLYFDDVGELINFSSEDRFDFDAGKRLKWSTPIGNYQNVDGYRIATSAEAVYHYPHGEVVYGTFELKKLSYNIMNAD